MEEPIFRESKVREKAMELAVEIMKDRHSPSTNLSTKEYSEEFAEISSMIFAVTEEALYCESEAAAKRRTKRSPVPF